MRSIIILLTSIICFFSIDSFAQLRPAQSQYLQQTGALINPSFEQGYKGWSITGDCTQSLESDIPYLNKTLKLTCVNQSFTVKQNTDLSAFVDQQALITAQVKANIGGMSVNSLTNDVISTTASVIAGDYKSINIPVKVGATSNGVEFSATSVTGEFFIDDVSLRLAPDLSYQVGQAQFVGSLDISATNCFWVTTNTSYADFPVDADCIYSSSGNVNAPDTNIPAIKLTNIRQDGYYKIEFNGSMQTEYSATTTQCWYALSENGTIPVGGKAITYANSNKFRGDANNLSHSFRFSDSADKTIRVITRRAEGGGLCRVFGDEVAANFTVHFYPDSNSTIVTQQTTVEKQERFLSANVSATSNDNADLRLTGLNTNKKYDIYLNLRAVFGTNSTCKLQAFDGGTQIGQAITANTGTGAPEDRDQFSYVVKNYKPNNTTITFDLVEQGTCIFEGQGTTNATYVYAQENTDSPTIIGKFEQIEEVTADLTAATANELSFTMESSGVVSNENYDVINGDCTKNATGDFTCSFNSGLFTENPSIKCMADITPVGVSLFSGALSTSSARILTYNTTTSSLQDSKIYCIVSKQGTDVNKSFTGAIINTSKNPRSASEDQYSETEIKWGLWNGQQLYRRCFTVPSTLTGAGTITTWDSGLFPKNTTEYQTDLYMILSRTAGSTFVNINYNKNTGDISYSTSGIFQISAGSSFCMDYTK